MSQVDEIDNAGVGIDTFHHNIHAGRVFFCNALYTTVADNGFARMLVEIPANYGIHVQPSITVEAKAYATIKEVGSYSNITSVVAENRNRFSSEASSAMLFTGGSLEVTSAVLSTTLFPAGSKNKAVGAAGGSFAEMVLNPGIWAVDVQNKSGGTQDIGIELDWYEPERG